MQKKRRFHFIVALEFIILIFSIFLFLLIYNAPITIQGFAIYESASDGSTINDTYLRDDFPNNNFGSGESLNIGKTLGSVNYHSLIRDYNISAIPIGNTIASAKLQVYVTDAYGKSNVTVKAYRVTSSWVELQATWNNRTSGVLWFSSGGDYNSNILDEINFTNQSGNYYNFSVVNTVRGWLNGSYENYGIILIATNAESGNYSYLASSNQVTPSYRPKFIIDYQENTVPTISNISTDSSLTNPKQVGSLVNISVNWSDLESDLTQLFVCNSSAINTSGCADRTFCNTSYKSSEPSSCTYAVQPIDNRTTAFYIAICDLGNCSEINQSYFYMNHNPEITVTDPNGGEIINQSQGNYLIKFNSSDPDTDHLTADLYYGTASELTKYLIYSNVNLTNNCTDIDSNPLTPNYCTYSWNSSQIYGTYYLTIKINDSFVKINDTSDSSFNVRSLADSIPPNITNQWLSDSDIFSGETITFHANVSELNINAVWISINTTPQTNLTMTNSSAEEYQVNWTATYIGDYQYKVYANDIIGNLNNSMQWQSFAIRKPNATTQNETSPSTALPYSTIRISAILNTSDSLKGIYAYLNVPEGFIFLSNYSQNNYMGNFSLNETKTVTWFVSVPLTESNYTLNITYTDSYSNIWNSSNFYISVSSAIGGGYFISITGYPEVETSNNYFSEAYFTQSGSRTNADSVYIKIYDASGSLVVGPSVMNNPSSGLYNYTYTVGASATEGQWNTIINATKLSTPYFANQFWKVVGGPFDIRDITILSSNISSLNISFIAENTGGANKDLIITWNLTREDNGQRLDSGSETFMVDADSEKTWYIEPSTTYVGQVRITVLGYYSQTEKAGAFKIFSTTSGNVTPIPTPTPTPGGGGGVSRIRNISKEKKADFEIISAEKEIFLTKNIEKTISLKIKNNGTEQLTDLEISLDSVDKKYYTVTPTRIKKLDPEKVAEFKIKFLIEDFIGQKNFNYMIKTKEISKKYSGSINVLNVRDYFMKEIERLRQRISDLKETTVEKSLLNEIGDCENIVNNLEQNVREEKIIKAEENVKKADDCLDVVIDKIKEKTEEKPSLLEVGYSAFLITWALILILIVILGFIIYILYKKFQVIKFMESEKKIVKPTSINNKYIEKRIKSIEEKLK